MENRKKILIKGIHHTLRTFNNALKWRQDPWWRIETGLIIIISHNVSDKTFVFRLRAGIAAGASTFSCTIIRIRVIWNFTFKKKWMIQVKRTICEDSSILAYLLLDLHGFHCHNHPNLNHVRLWASLWNPYLWKTKNIFVVLEKTVFFLWCNEDVTDRFFIFRYHRRSRRPDGQGGWTYTTQYCTIQHNTILYNIINNAYKECNSPIICYTHTTWKWKNKMKNSALLQR